MQKSTLVSLTGRSVDFAAALVSSTPEFDTALAATTRLAIAPSVAEDSRYRRHRVPSQRCMGASTVEFQPPAHRSFNELESMIATMFAALRSSSSIDPRMEILEAPESANRLFVEDAFTNPEHLRFVLSGTLAAMLCYILYIGMDWPGISTSVTTCVLTAVSNIGSSRQKQVLRLAGAILGGFIFALGSQIFILPYIDSIAGFAVLFASVTAVAAWVTTSSSRLSYAGLQIALAYYLIMLSEFRIQLSLSVARDRAVGVLLGVSMMWLVFERFYTHPAADEMIRVFIRTLRLMAAFVSESGIGADALKPSSSSAQAARPGLPLLRRRGQCPGRRRPL